jgi:hypothetical protein
LTERETPSGLNFFSAAKRIDDASRRYSEISPNKNAQAEESSESGPSGKRDDGGLSTFVGQAHPSALAAGVVHAPEFPHLAIAIEGVNAGAQAIAVVGARRGDLHKLGSFFHLPFVPSLKLKHSPTDTPPPSR